MSLDADGFVETDDSFRTTTDGVYAIGDVSGPPMFTHSARDDADLLYRHLASIEGFSPTSHICRGHKRRPSIPVNEWTVYNFYQLARS